jgi:hypothetical protein
MSSPVSTSFRQLIQAGRPKIYQYGSQHIRLTSTLSSGHSTLNEPFSLKLQSSHTVQQQQQHRGLRTTPNPLNHRRMHPDDDRCSINTERSEYTNSGTDNEVASQRLAFDPTNIDPEREQEASGLEVQQAGDVGNPLEVSPANREVSRTLDPMEGGAQRGMDRGPSMRFSPKKGTKVSMAGWTGSGGPMVRGGKSSPSTTSSGNGGGAV